MEEKEYYMWNGQYAENSLVFWRDGGGYSPNVEEAQLFTKSQALRIENMRGSDIAIHKDRVEGAKETHVNSDKVANRRHRLSLFDVPNFISHCINGNASPDQLEEYIACWHDGDSESSLQEFLGLTQDEFKAILIEGGSTVEEVVEERKAAQP